MWEISNIGQSTAFLWSMLLGGILSVVYDIFRLDRMIFKRSVLAVALEDVLFFIISAISIFCLQLVTTNGQMRGFIFIGIIIGFLILRLTLSRFVDLLLKPLKKLVKYIRTKYNVFVLKAADFDAYFIKALQFLKKLLKKPQKPNKNSKKTEKTS